MAVMVRGVTGDAWASVECDRRGCDGHVTVRTAEAHQTPYDAACLAFDIAEAEGWRLVGRTYCPDHAQGGLGRSVRLADGFAWARTAWQGVKGGQRPA